MKAFLSFTIVICSFIFISVAETDLSCDEHVNERFCSSFRNVSSRVIDGPQYETYRSYGYSYDYSYGRYRYTTRQREIFIDRSQVHMACNSSNTFTFSVSNNSDMDYYDYYNDYSNDSSTESLVCEYKIVDDYSICINENISEVAVSTAITHAIVIIMKGIKILFNNE